MTETILDCSLLSVVRPGVTGWAHVRYGYANNLNVIVGTDPARIVAAARAAASGRHSERRTPELWDGRTAARIVSILTGRRSALPGAPIAAQEHRP